MPGPWLSLSLGYEIGYYACNDDPEDSCDDRHPVTGCLPFGEFFQVKMAGIIGIVEDLDRFPDPELIRPDRNVGSRLL